MDAANERLGRAAQRVLGTSYSRAKHEVLIGHVLVNGAVVTDPGAVVASADVVTHDPGLPRRSPAPKLPPIRVIHLDEDVLVVDKPAGLLIHPTTESEEDTVVSRAGAEVERRTGHHRRVHVVHRLDRETSGVMVLALSHAAAEHLQRQFRAHTVERRYVALVRGPFSAERRVDRAIGRPRPGARRAALAPGGGGRPAVTVFRPLERLGAVTLVEAELGTGRTHQVRIHLSYLGHPVLGDPVYGEPSGDPFSIGRVALHAEVLGFVHPATGKRLVFRQPPPQDFSDLLTRLRRRLRAQAHEPGGPSQEHRDPKGSGEATTPPRPRTPRRPSAGGAPRPSGTRTRPKPARPRRRASGPRR